MAQDPKFALSSGVDPALLRFLRRSAVIAVCRSGHQRLSINDKIGTHLGNRIDTHLGTCAILPVGYLILVLPAGLQEADCAGRQDLKHLTTSQCGRLRWSQT